MVYWQPWWPWRPWWPSWPRCALPRRSLSIRVGGYLTRCAAHYRINPSDLTKRSLSESVPYVGIELLGQLKTCFFLITVYNLKTWIGKNSFPSDSEPSCVILLLIASLCSDSPPSRLKKLSTCSDIRLVGGIMDYRGFWDSSLNEMRDVPCYKGIHCFRAYKKIW